MNHETEQELIKALKALEEISEWVENGLKYYDTERFVKEDCRHGAVYYEHFKKAIEKAIVNQDLSFNVHPHLKLKE